MKTTIALTFITLSLAACGGETPTPQGQATVTVTVTKEAEDASLKAQEKCRAEARKVFPAVIADTMPQAEGQARIDKACKGVDALSRAAIIEAARVAAFANA